MKSLALTMLSNICIMAFFGSLSVRFFPVGKKRGQLFSQVAQILLTVGLSVLVTQFPLITPDGGRYDLRSVPVIISGIFGGPVAGLVTGVLVALYRWSLGGAFALQGMVAIMSNGLVSGAFSSIVTAGRLARFPIWRALIPGLVANVFSIWFQYMSLPYDVFIPSLKRLLPTIMLYQPAAVAILVYIFQHDYRSAETTAGLREQNRQDAKTRLLNSSAFEQSLSDKLNDPEMRPVSVLFLDIDHFKRVNDTYGHEVGDMVLQELSQRLLATVRPEDRVARFGGEEFTVCLSACAFSNALSIAERIRQDVQSQPFCLESSSEGLLLTISIGVAASDGGTARDILRKADRAMYRAKEAGRNKVVGYSFLLEEKIGS